MFLSGFCFLKHDENIQASKRQRGSLKKRTKIECRKYWCYNNVEKNLTQTNQLSHLHRWCEYDILIVAILAVNTFARKEWVFPTLSFSPFVSIPDSVSQ